MQNFNYNGAAITKLVDMQGKRIGAFINTHGTERLDSTGILRLGQHLFATKQQLGNATITADGRIIPKAKLQVQEWTYSDVLPEGFKRNDGALNAPKGYYWAHNGKPLNEGVRFSACSFCRFHALLYEFSLVFSSSFSCCT